MKTYRIGHFNAKGNVVAEMDIVAENLRDAKTMYLKRYTKQTRANLVGHAITEEVAKSNEVKEEKKMTKKESKKSDQVAKVKADAKTTKRIAKAEDAPKKTATKKTAKAAKADAGKASAKKATKPAIVYWLNEEHKGVEIKFPEKPSAKVRTALKTNGFRWHNQKQVWYAKQGAKADAIVKALKAQKVAMA